jgi:hypothetical protein
MRFFDLAADEAPIRSKVAKRQIKNLFMEILPELLKK